MELNLQNLNQDRLDQAALFYEENGYLLLNSIDNIIINQYEELLKEITGTGADAFPTLLDPGALVSVFPPETRKALSRVTTPPELKRMLVEVLGPVLKRLIGPLIHVSSNFHSQFKGAPVPQVDHGGYPAESEYMEVHGAYLLHQDFAGASFPTSPSMITFWTPLNTTPHWNLRLYAGSHRLGLLCNTWLNLEDRRLPALGKPVDIAARRGSGVLFNGLMLHGTSNAGVERRVSCDLRFFPLCGFLPSEVYPLSSDPRSAMQQSLERSDGPVLQSPLLEARAYLSGKSGTESSIEDVPLYSVMNWINYVRNWCRGDGDAALPHLQRFVNQEMGADPPEVFVNKFHRYPICEDNLQAVRKQLS